MAAITPFVSDDHGEYRVCAFNLAQALQPHPEQAVIPPEIFSTAWIDYNSIVQARTGGRQVEDAIWRDWILCSLLAISLVTCCMVF